MFFSANNVTGSSSDISLASLMAMNNANATEYEHIWGTETGESCKIFTLDTSNTAWNPDCNCYLPTQVVTNGTQKACPGWELTGCISTDCK